MPCELKLGPERHTCVELGSFARLAIIAESGSRGAFSEQARELFAQVRCIVSRQSVPLVPITMIVFLRDAADEHDCRAIAHTAFGEEMPVTTFVAQAPCSGAALGVELWALGGSGIEIERLGPALVSTKADGIRWIYTGGIQAAAPDPYSESLSAFTTMEQQLARAGVGFEHVMRTWIYVNQITAGPDGRQRYQELNRARTDFFRDIPFGAKSRGPATPPAMFPASTGIGSSGTNIAMACMALDSKRPDVFVVPLENPQQTPAYDYTAHYSPQSPKFSRAMAVVQGGFVATLVSGTASIVNSKTVFVGDVTKQTEQTLDNIEQLIAAENFARHGLAGCGASLRDVAKLRVYVKHQQDYEKCREVVERRLPGAPAIYLVADVCRPDLLVEIEAVAFSPVRRDVNGHPHGGQS